MTEKRTLGDERAKLKIKFLEYYAELPIFKLAAESIGKDEDTILRWRKDDTVFAEQVQSARAEWAKRKSNKVKSNEWLLERVMHDHFKEVKEVDHGVTDELSQALDRMAEVLKKK